MMNAWEISRRIREYNEQSHPNRPKMPLVELDEYEMEIFWAYWEILKEIGVDAIEDYLQEALNCNPPNMENAILALIEYNNRPGHEWNDEYHPTRFLAKALREGWKPHKLKSFIA